MPSVFRTLRGRLRALWRRDVITDEIADEMQFHLEQRAEALELQGWSRAEARRLAARRFGNLTRLRDEGYDVRGGGLIETVWQDIRFGLHLMKIRRAFSVAAVLTLALGIGLTSALLSVVDAAWLRPLPFAHPDRIMTVRLAFDEGGDENTNAPSQTELRTLRRSDHLVAAIGEWHAWEQRQILDTGEPERAKVLQMSEGYPEVYGVIPVLGRTFTEEDGRAGAPPVVLLGHHYWHRRFGGEPSIVGRTLLLEGVATMVVGVLPPSFHRDAQMWQPRVTTREQADRRGSGADVHLRLQPGITRGDAEAALRDAIPGTRIKLTPVFAETIETTRQTVTTLAAAVGLLVLLVCVNVGGLMLASGAERRRELAVRASMGAGRARLVRQLLTEAGILGGLASVIGVVAAWWSLDGLVAVLPMERPPHVVPSMNPLVVVATMGAALATTFAVSIWPAWRLTRSSLSELMAGAGRRSVMPWSRRTGPALITIEVALAVVLLIGSGLLLRSLDRLLSVDLGFQPEAVQMLEASPATNAKAVWADYYPALLERLRALPGVEAAGATDSPPLGDTGMAFSMVPHRGDMVSVDAPSVTPGYFEAFGFRVLEGRTFSVRDQSQPVVVINDAAARRLFPGERAVGQSLAFPTAMTVIGVVSNIRQSGPRVDVTETIYSWLVPDSRMPPTVVIRATAAGPSIDSLRQAALSLGPRALVERILPGTALLSNTVARPRHRTLLLGLLGGLGFLLTLIGTAGVTAYAVSRRTREIGVRMAFGADTRSVVWTMMRDATWPVAVGLLLGIGASLYANRLVASFLFETTPTDPLTFAAVGTLLGVATIGAAWLPARKAARVDPVQALRAE